MEPIRPMENVNMRLQPTGVVPYTRFGDFCRKYGDAFLFGYAPDGINTTAYPTDYSDTVANCLTKPGLHVWIVFADGTFGAARVFSTFEILSKHQDVYLRHGEKAVIAAGEVRVEETGVTFNLQSGTFMLPISEAFSTKYKNMGSYESFYVPWMTDFWKTAGANSVTYVEPSMISDMPITEDQLRMYDAVGVEFRQFPTQKECLKYADYYTSLAKAKRSAIRKIYDQQVLRGEKRSFEDWIVATGRAYAFTPPAPVPRMFHGGRKSRKGHKTRKPRTRRG